jgi:hypothetical protein
VYDENAVYEPEWVLNPSGLAWTSASSYFQHPFEMLVRCSLRRPDDVVRADFKLPHGSPEYVDPRLSKQRGMGPGSKATGGKVPGGTKVVGLGLGLGLEVGGSSGSSVGFSTGPDTSDMFAEDRKGIGKIRAKVDFALDSPEAMAMTQFIHTSLAEVYSKVVVRNVWSNKSRTQIWATTKSSWCQNVNRNHNKNTVYFVATSKDGKISQKCWCTCPTVEGRLHGLCSDYHSTGIRLPSDVLMVLFPNRNGARKKLGQGRTNFPSMKSVGTSLMFLADELKKTCAKALGGRPPLRVMGQARLF